MNLIALDLSGKKAHVIKIDVFVQPFNFSFHFNLNFFSACAWCCVCGVFLRGLQYDWEKNNENSFFGCSDSSRSSPLLSPLFSPFSFPSLSFLFFDLKVYEINHFTSPSVRSGADTYNFYTLSFNFAFRNGGVHDRHMQLTSFLFL